MSLLMENSVAKIGCGDPGDPIEFGALFNGGYLLRMFAASGDTTKWSLVWRMKLATLGTARGIFGAGETSTGNVQRIQLFPDDTLGFYSGNTLETVSVDRKMRDAAAHSTFQVDFDSNAANILTFIKDGQIIGVSNTPPSPAQFGYINSNRPHAIGEIYGGSPLGMQFNGCGSDFIFFDSINPDPFEFVRINSDGAPVPKLFASKGQGAAAYGATGFHLDFSDPLDLGKDVSGNGNHFTVVGDVSQSSDTPTNNQPTGNPLASIYTGGGGGGVKYETQLQEGGLYLPGNSAYQGYQYLELCHKVPRSYYYFQVETFAIAGSGSFYVCGASGHAVAAADVTVKPNTIYNFAVTPTHIYVREDGVWIIGDPVEETGGIPRKDDLVTVSDSDGNTGYYGQLRLNFGSSPYPYPSPSGKYQNLSTANWPCPVIIDPSRYVQAPVSIGGSAVTALWNCLASNTLVISKRRDAVADYRLNVVIGGVQHTVAINVDGAEITDADGLTFTANGFDLGADTVYQGTCEHFARRASPLAGMDFVLIDSHVAGQVSTVAHNCGGAIHRAWDIPLDGGNIRQFHHKMPTGDYTLVNIAGRGNDPDWFSSTANTASLGGASVSGRHLLLLERGVRQFSSFDVYDGYGLEDGAFIPTDFAPLVLDVVRGDAAGPHTMRSLRAGEANPVTVELRYDGEDAANTISDKFYLLSHGAKVATNAAASGGEHTNLNGGKYYTGMYAMLPGKFASAR